MIYNDLVSTVVKFDYTYAANENNIYRKTFDHRTYDPYNEYSYDNLDRLTQADYLVNELTNVYEAFAWPTKKGEMTRIYSEKVSDPFSFLGE